MDCTITPIRLETEINQPLNARPLRLGGLSVIQTTDTLYPLIPDPFQFGRFVCVLIQIAVLYCIILYNSSDRIACASLLSAVYAAGVTSVDNILCHLSISTR